MFRRIPAIFARISVFDPEDLAVTKHGCFVTATSSRSRDGSKHAGIKKHGRVSQRSATHLNGVMLVGCVPLRVTDPPYQ
jgi:hypothetical protein